jgi:ferrous iron transport protein B
MNRIGLHGKSFMPLALSGGCNVAGITGTRIVEGERTRLMTIILAPIVPCMATMMFLIFLAGVFFPGFEGIVLIGIYLLDIAIIAVSGLVLGRFVVKGEKTAFILELPEYQRPNRLTVWKTVRHHGMHFLKKAGPIIMIVSVGTWALAYFPSGNLDTSYLAMIGQFMIPAMRASLSPAGALAFMIANVIFFPCMGAVGAIASESKSWRWALFTLIWLFLLTMGVAIVVFQVASLFM